MERAFTVASEDEVIRGEVTDVYFIRTVDVLKAAGLDKVKVRAEFHVMSLPRDYEWAVYTGLSEVLELVRRAGLKVNVYSMPEGTVFQAKEPLMIIEGNYIDFAVYETPILGILRHYSSISSKAARIKYRAMNKQCLFFGARALHPIIQPMADKAAYMGGCDGVANVVGARLLGIPASGTMPHALMIVFKAVKNDHTLAWVWFDRVVPGDVPRIVLADTFLDEREEALMAAKLLGERLSGVRLDTPSSRRGNMKAIVEEVKWTLELAGYRNVKIIVSGGLDEEAVSELSDLVDSFGVGTSIAFPPSVDISMDIVEYYDEGLGKWVPLTKRGKMPGFKQVYRCSGFRDFITPFNSTVKCPDGSEPEALIRKVYDESSGVLVSSKPSDVRDHVLAQLSELKKSNGSVSVYFSSLGG
ncbi:nicotinate phosphoribosyltransferase [Caldivirga maquilingensis]|uniref:nicotinate phosphoribosyltransferase n=1 Tax=Caldivirga maquilingensis (strain ATCC 700844 / DSM 13496 / JCM 10307 / IC-167) TaxID=397948 RepID=A8MDA9_CALMQ|nr:nicotinate phosphoribosyltransferase [Caldivirga maquilingensis]ABW01765.1 Quinolinate phosphoribosyl transferase [Caldivirga maquilingensis IC-167]